MSFGFSVSDFVGAIELANKIRKEFRDAPSQFKAISDEYIAATEKRTTLIIQLIGSEVFRSSSKMPKSPYRSGNSTLKRRLT